MKIKVVKLIETDNETIREIFVDDQFMCYCMEKKSTGVIIIQEGKYTLTLRKEGAYNKQYIEKFGAEFHRGVLWIRDAPNLKLILIHDEDKPGCLFVGLTHNGTTIGESTNAYKKLYPIVAGALVNGEQVTIEYEQER